MNILPASQLRGVYGKVNKIGGSVVFLNERYVNNIINGKDRNTLPHEFGHSLGLLHVDGADAWFLGLLDEANTMIVTNKKEIDIMLCLVELIVNIQMITNLLILIQSRLA